MKVIYIDRNFIAEKYKNGPDDGDAYYTYGFGGIYSREFKKYNPGWEVECWKADSRTNRYSSKTISGVKFCMYPAKEIPHFGVSSSSMRKDLKAEIVKTKELVVNISSLGHYLFYQIASVCSSIPLFVQGHGETTAKMDRRIRKGIFRRIKALLHIPFEMNAVKNVNVYYALDTRFNKELPITFKGECIVQTTGVDTDVFKAIDKKDAKKSLDLEVSKKYILFVGRLDFTKRADLLIDVWEELRENHPQWQLLLAGNSPNMPLTERAESVGAIIKGRIIQTEMNKYLSAADIYVLANLKGIHTYGGVGMLPVQALFCETPVVGVTVRNIPEKIQSQLGIYTDTKEELKEALFQIMTAKRKFSNLRELAKNEYSWKNISNRTSQKYLEYLMLNNKKMQE